MKFFIYNSNYLCFNRKVKPTFYKIKKIDFKQKIIKIISNIKLRNSSQKYEVFSNFKLINGEN